MRIKKNFRPLLEGSHRVPGVGIRNYSRIGWKPHNGYRSDFTNSYFIAFSYLRVFTNLSFITWRAARKKAAENLPRLNLLLIVNLFSLMPILLRRRANSALLTPVRFNSATRILLEILYHSSMSGIICKNKQFTS